METNGAQGQQECDSSHHVGGGGGGGGAPSTIEYALKRSPGAMLGKFGPPSDMLPRLPKLPKLPLLLACVARMRGLRAAVPTPAMLERQPNSANSSLSSLLLLSGAAAE